MSNIDITKTYTTCDEREVVIFEVSDRVYCKIKCSDGWAATSRSLNGMVVEFGKYSSGDLILAKTWRAWKEGEGPKRLMIHWENHAADTCEIVIRPMHYSDAYLFENASWLHEDGTTTPCGVLEE